MACSSWLRETARELMIMMEHCRACGVEVLVSNSWSTLKLILVLPNQSYKEIPSLSFPVKSRINPGNLCP